MTDQYFEYDELRPIGEATQVADHELANRADGEIGQTETVASRTGYPERPPETTVECRACGTSISTGRTKCRFCLTNYVEPVGDDRASAEAEWTLLHVIYAIVEASTSYEAIAKGAAATSLLAKADADPAIDDCRLIDGLDEEPATQLKRRWGSLPPAVRVRIERGQQLLEAACEHTDWSNTPPSDCDEGHATFLYDETGSGIRDEQCLETLREDTKKDCWLIPALALQRGGENVAVAEKNQRGRTQSHIRLRCRACREDTVHRFHQFEDVPTDEWAGQPMWECRGCQTSRYGPDPEGD